MDKQAAAAAVAEAANDWLEHPREPERYQDLVAAVSAWRGAGTPPRPSERAAETAPVPDQSSQPKMHRDRDFLRAKQAQWRAPHVAPIQALVDEIRTARHTDTVPYVDPVSGGVNARVLFILESPAGPAALGSGMLSPDNDDETAANMWQLYRQSGLSRAAGLHWNAVPWYTGTDGRNGPVSGADVCDGLQWLDRLLALLPELRLVITMGKPAQRSFEAYVATPRTRRLEWLAAGHPSPRVKNGHPRLWPGIEAAFARAAEVAATGEAAAAES